MIPIDFYSTNVSNGYGDYGLIYRSEITSVKQIGETVDRQTELVQKRFVAADGTPIVYAGYAEDSSTLLFECASLVSARQLRALAQSGSFAATGTILADNFDGATNFGRLFYTSGSVTTTRISASFYQVSVPVQMITSGVDVPSVRLTTSGDRGIGFEIGGTWVYTADCRVAESGYLWCKMPVYFDMTTTNTKLYAAAQVGNALVGTISMVLRKVSGTAQTVDTTQAAKLPGADVTISEGNGDYYLEITAANAKPIRIYFSIRRYGA